eukprot:TRINITY_DN8793_c0_g1_i1.p1 TRINITY_DN8793_c0_g1~~TRINITY_DN8793_c0_g1_i1.p1  ORF type:complete len:155 (-),score=16.47 TRINITY_DN8793_c0_g1_i1:99-563(-)
MEKGKDFTQFTSAVAWLSHAFMSLFFCFAGLLQINDPDPHVWLPVYIIAALLSALTCMQRNEVRYISFIYGTFCLVWGISIFLDLPSTSSYGEIFSFEEGRELGGLLIIAFEMFLSCASLFSTNKLINFLFLLSAAFALVAIVLGIFLPAHLSL